MSSFKVATVLVYVTSVLTSTVNGNPISDEDSSSPGLKGIFGTSKPSNGPVSVSQEHGTPVEIMSEAGSMVGSSAMTSRGVIKSYGQPLAVGAKDVSQPDEDPLSLLALDAGTKISQIKARKGVGNEAEAIGREGVRFSTEVATDITKMDRESLRQTVNDNKTSAVTPRPRIVTTEAIVNKNETSDSKTPEKDKADNRLDQVTRLPIMIVPGRGNKTAIHIPKPTVTSGEGNDDGEGMPSSATQTEFGMPKKVDYVIPVVITIMATPVLGIAAYILYTRGRDCWDKRHYRRMDFLIDGMYND